MDFFLLWFLGFFLTSPFNNYPLPKNGRCPVHLWPSSILLHGEYSANPQKRSPVREQPELEDNYSKRRAASPPHRSRVSRVLLLIMSASPAQPLQNHRKYFPFVPALLSVQEEGWSCGSRSLGCQRVWLLFLVVTAFSCDFGRVI